MPSTTKDTCSSRAGNQVAESWWPSAVNPAARVALAAETRP
ncbi:hypothetical protein [Actinoallomurus iriomotensis]|nr:hypothetical protein [Actinoallomurus iriomotensis]